MTDVATIVSRSFGPSILGEGIVGIAVEPPLTGLRRGNDRVLGRAHVLRRVTIRRRVATKRNAASLAGAEVDPCRANLHAFLAFATLADFHRFDAGNMVTG